MKYKCTGYRILEQDDGTQVRQPCEVEAEEGNLFVKTWVMNREIRRPTIQRIVEHALCAECVSNINQHLVEEKGKKPIPFPRFKKLMNSARAREGGRCSTTQSKRKTLALMVTCGYCSREDSFSKMVCEELSALKRRLGGDNPTQEQMLEVGICEECSSMPFMRALAKLVPMTSVMEVLGFLSNQKQESVVS